MSDRALGPGSKFRYYPAKDTNLKRTFDRIRREMRERGEQKRQQPTEAVPFRRKERD